MNEVKINIGSMRRALARQLTSQRVALRELRRGIYRDDMRTILEIEEDWKRDMFIIHEYLHDVEWENGLPILSKTRAEWRREGKNVN